MYECDDVCRSDWLCFVAVILLHGHFCFAKEQCVPTEQWFGYLQMMASTFGPICSMVTTDYSQ